MNLFRRLKNLLFGIVIKFQKTGACFQLPTQGTDEAAGYDLYATHTESIKYLNTVVIDVGFAMELPKGYMALILPRSGNSLKLGMLISNSPGLIDADYRGKVGVIVTNRNEKEDRLVIKRGDKIAQMIIIPVTNFRTIESDTLSLTDRGEKGYGSTDKKKTK